MSALTDTRDALLVAAYAAGGTMREVASVHGVSHATVQRALEAAGVKRRPSGRGKLPGSRAARYYVRLKEDPPRWGKKMARQRKSRLAKKFGVQPVDYISLLDVTACQACGAEEKGQHLAIDHCHATGLVRGALCRACNLALGLVQDDTNKLKALITYLERCK